MANDHADLSDPPERQRLEPYATVFLEVMLAEAIGGGWFETKQSPSQNELTRISRRIDQILEHHLGHAVHPAIYVHALLVCGHFCYQATKSDEVMSPAEENLKRLTSIDAAFSLTQCLMLHHALSDLYVRLS